MRDAVMANTVRMGQSKRRRAQFLAAHPLCCFCGAASEEPDHVPPRQLFHRRMAPEGFEVPACAKCNRATRLDEIVVGYYSRLQKDDPPGETNPHINLLIGLRNNVPEALPKPLSTIGKRRALRASGTSLPAGQTIAETPLVGVPNEAIEAFERYVCKATCAVIYRETNTIPSSALFWSRARPSTVMPVDRMRELLPFKFDNKVWPTVQHRLVNDVFAYSWTLAEDKSCFAVEFEFGTAFTALGLCITSASDMHLDDGEWFDALGVPVRRPVS